MVDLLNTTADDVVHCLVRSSQSRPPGRWGAPSPRAFGLPLLPVHAGEVGIQEELDLVGIQHIGGPADAGKVVELTPGLALDHDKDVAAGMHVKVPQAPSPTGAGCVRDRLTVRPGRHHGIVAQCVG